MYNQLTAKINLKETTQTTKLESSLSELKSTNAINNNQDEIGVQIKQYLNIR